MSMNPSEVYMSARLPRLDPLLKAVPVAGWTQSTFQHSEADVEVEYTLGLISMNQFTGKPTLPLRLSPYTWTIWVRTHPYYFQLLTMGIHIPVTPQGVIVPCVS